MNDKSRMPSDHVDIRATWVKHWPKPTQDAVYERIKRQVEANEAVPENTTKIRRYK